MESSEELGTFREENSELNFRLTLPMMNFSTIRQ
jgi:hypothetical protein